MYSSSELRWVEEDDWVSVLRGTAKACEDCDSSILFLSPSTSISYYTDIIFYINCKNEKMPPNVKKSPRKKKKKNLFRYSSTKRNTNFRIHFYFHFHFYLIYFCQHLLPKGIKKPTKKKKKSS